MACEQQKTTDHVNSIAQVGNNHLFKADIKKSLPKQLNYLNDTAGYTSNYINKWIKQQLLINEAKKELSAYDLNLIEEKVANYREELIIHNFKESKIGAIIEKEISPEEVIDYYNNHLKLFVLFAPIVQVDYMIFPMEAKLTRKFRRQLLDKNEKSITEKEDFIFKNAKRYDDFNDKWLYFDQIKSITKLDSKNDEEFLNENQIIEFNTETEIHIVVINQFLTTNMQAPIEFVEPRIKSLIRNERKLDFLREIKDSLYNDGLKYNKFRVSNF